MIKKITSGFIVLSIDSFPSRAIQVEKWLYIRPIYLCATYYLIQIDSSCCRHSNTYTYNIELSIQYPVKIRVSDFHSRSLSYNSQL